MIASVGEGGASFTGAGKYYLGEGRFGGNNAIANYMLEPQADGNDGSRVGFTAVRNLPTQVALEGFQAMQATYDRYRELNAPRPGRKLDKPVYHYSLSWSPDETVTKAEMMEAAKVTLKVLGMDKLQAVIVEHTDKDYQHIHVTVNRVNPDMKKAASTSMDRYNLSKWAEAYERERGTVFCERRVENNKRRDRGEWVKDTVSKSRQEIEAERLAESRATDSWKVGDKEFAGTVLSQIDRDRYFATRAVYDVATERMEKKFYAELDAVFVRAEKLDEKNRVRIKQEYKPRWRAIYGLERNTIQHIKEDRSNIFERAAYVFTAHATLSKYEPLEFGDIAKMVLSEKKLIDRIEQYFKQERCKLGDQQKEAIVECIEQTRAGRNREVNPIIERQELERKAFVQSMDEDLGKYSSALPRDDIPSGSFFDRVTDGASDNVKGPGRGETGKSFLDRVEQKEDREFDPSKGGPILDDGIDRGL